MRFALLRCVRSIGESNVVSRGGYARPREEGACRRGARCPGLLGGCGAVDGDERCVERVQTTPKPNVDRRPRVEGRWQVVYAPLGGEHQEQRARWAATPSRFVYAPAPKEWIGGDPQRGACYVLMQRVYRIGSQIMLTPLRAVRGAKGTDPPPGHQMAISSVSYGE